MTCAQWLLILSLVGQCGERWTWMSGRVGKENYLGTVNISRAWLHILRSDAAVFVEAYLTRKSLPQAM